MAYKRAAAISGVPDDRPGNSRTEIGPDPITTTVRALRIDAKGATQGTRAQSHTAFEDETPAIPALAA